MCTGPAPETCINYTLSINSQQDRGEFPFLSHPRGLLSPTISWEAGSPSVATSTISRAKLSSPAHLRASRAFSDRPGCWSISVPSSQAKGRRMEHKKLHSSLGLGTTKGGAGRRKSPANAAKNHNSNMCPAFSVHGTVQSNWQGLFTQVILTTAPWGSTINIPILQMKYGKAKDLS